MPDDKWERVQEIFLEAADLPKADRDGFLDQCCNGDHGLRREVELLLQADTEGVSVVEDAIETEAASMLDEAPS